MTLHELRNGKQYDCLLTVVNVKLLTVISSLHLQVPALLQDCDVEESSSSEDEDEDEDGGKQESVGEESQIDKKVCFYLKL